MVSAVQCPGAPLSAAPRDLTPHLGVPEQPVEEADGPWRFKVSEPTGTCPGSFPTAPGRAECFPGGWGCGPWVAGHRPTRRPPKPLGQNKAISQNGQGRLRAVPSASRCSSRERANVPPPRDTRGCGEGLGAPVQVLLSLPRENTGLKCRSSSCCLLCLLLI